MITEKGISLIASSILNLIDHGEIVIDGEKQELKLYRTNIENNYIKIFLLFDDETKGKITETKLISKQGEIIIDKADLIEKTVSRGLLIVFSLKISEVKANERIQ